MKKRWLMFRQRPISIGKVVRKMLFSKLCEAECIGVENYVLSIQTEED